MGAIVDTGVFIVHERRGYRAQELQTALTGYDPENRFALSSVTLAELAAGIYRAKTVEQHSLRYTFVEEVSIQFPVASFTQHTAWIAGRLRGEQSKIGNTLPMADSLIAATAIEYDYAVITLNVQDFIRIPGLRVIPFILP